ncbi:MAG: rubredoxin [Acutalibacteraceae bacterium]
MVQKRKYMAFIVFLVVILSVGAAFLGYHLANEYKTTIVETFESALSSLKEKISDMEDEVQNITLQEDKKLTAEESQCYVCKLCGWVYNPKTGNPEQGIDKNTPFASVRNDWLCPVCGAAKKNFYVVGNKESS